MSVSQHTRRLGKAALSLLLCRCCWVPQAYEPAAHLVAALLHLLHLMRRVICQRHRLDSVSKVHAARGEARGEGGGKGKQ